MLRRLSPFALLAAAGLVFFLPLVLHPTHVLYSPRSDLLAMHLPAKRFLVRSWHETGELPLWYPYSYGGMPLVHDVQVAVFYPPHWPLLLLREEHVGAYVSWLTVLHVLAAGCFAYLYARSQGVGAAAGLVTGLGTMFAGKWLLHLLAGGHTIMAPLAWLPLALLLLEGAIRHGRFLRATWAGVVYALIVLGTHPQMTFYAGLFLGLWTLGTALEMAGFLGGDGPRSRARTLRALARWALCGGWAAAVAIALSAVQLLPALEATPETTRDVGVPAGELLKASLPTLLRLLGPSLDGPHWEVQGSFGFLWAAAAALAPFLCRGRVRFYIAAVLLLLFFSVGGAAIVQGLPGFRLFQLPGRMLLLVSFPVALFAGFTTQALLDLPAAARRRRLLGVASAVVFLGLALLGLQALRLRSDGLLPFPPYLASLLLSAPVALWLLSRPAAALSHLWAPLWIVVLTADLWALTWPLVEVRPEDEVYSTPACVRDLARRRAEAEPERFRVLDRGERRKYPSSGALGVSLPPLGQVALEPVLGYNTFDVRRYKEYLQFIAGADEPILPRRGDFGYPIVEPFPIRNKPLLDLLGVRYLLVSQRFYDDEKLRSDQEPLVFTGGQARPNPAWTALPGGDDRPVVYSFLEGGMTALAPHTVYENRTAFPRAFVVPRAAPLPRRDKVLPALLETDLRQTVLLDGWDGQAETGESGSCRPARVSDYRPNRVVIEAEGPGYLVLTDVWFPGWQCTVDDVATVLYRANHVFRAVRLEKGSHRVEFTFAPVSYRRGRQVSVAAFLGVLGLTSLGGAVARRRPGKNISQPFSGASTIEA